MKTRPINRQTILQYLLEYELELAGKTMVDMIDSANYRFEFTLTSEQLGEFKKHAVFLIKKVFRCNKTRAENTFNWFWQTFGLRIKNE